MSHAICRNLLKLTMVDVRLGRINHCTLMPRMSSTVPGTFTGMVRRAVSGLLGLTDGLHF